MRIRAGSAGRATHEGLEPPQRRVDLRRGTVSSLQMLEVSLGAPDFCQLVRTFRLGDQVERLAEIGREWVLGGEDLQAGADLDGAVAAGGVYEPADRPAGALLDQAADRERGEHDRQV